jgi:CrcB protein
MKWILVFTGSGIGGCLRFWIGEQTKKWLNVDFPYGTLIANFAACIILGIVVGLAGTQWLDEKTRIFLSVGLCGGFSTFSAFSNETLQMFSNHKVVEGSAYVIISVISCIGAVYFGSALVKWLS